MTPPIPGPAEGLNGAVAAELRAERAAQNMTVQQLAESSEVPYASLRRYLAGERHIDVATLAALATALDVGPGDIVARAAARLRLGDKVNQGDVILFPAQPAKTVVVADVSGEEDSIETLYDEPSAAEPPRRDIEGEVDPDLQ